MSKSSTYEALVARGCLCGTERPQDCTLHGVGDNRGLAAYFKAGMPNAFPCVATCSLCRSDGLLYPNVGLDTGTGGYKPTVVCPRCSAPVCERALVAEVEASGLHKLNTRRVFSAAEEAIAA